MAGIPYLIHQTFYHQADIPAEILSNINSLKSKNPAWKYNFYSHRDMFLFVRANYSTRILKAFNSINPMYGAARSDFFRYLLIYKIGGVYLDLKSNVNKSLNEIVDGKKFILSHWNNRRGDEYEGWGLHFKGLPRGEYQQWYIASVPGHPLLEKVILLVLHNIENYNPEISGVGAEAVLKTTGPVAYTQAIHPNLQVADYKLFDTHLDAGFIYSCFGKYGDDFFRHARLDSRFPHYSTLTDRLVFN